MKSVTKKGKYIAVRPNQICEAIGELTSKQLDVLDIVFNQINDDENYKYDINVRDYMDLYANKVNPYNAYKDLESAIEIFRTEKRGFAIYDKTGDRTWFAWFSSIKYWSDKKRITVAMGDELKDIFLEMKKKNGGRIYYDIRYTLNFKSIYSKRLYYMLMQFKETGWKKIDLDKLKEILGCKDEYKEYREFNRRVLKVAQKEINKDSDITFEIEESRNGRKVESLKFIITKKSIENCKYKLDSEEKPVIEEPIKEEEEKPVIEEPVIKKPVKQEPINIKTNNEEVKELWNLYPLKKGKANADKTMPKLIKQYGFEQMKRTIERYIADVTKQRFAFPTLNYVIGSTFFNGRYMDYLDENVEVATTTIDKKETNEKVKLNYAPVFTNYLL